MIEHRSAVNFLASMQKEPGFKENDVLLAVTTVSFDIAAMELFLPVITGGKVVMARKDEVIVTKSRSCGTSRRAHLYLIVA